MAENGAICTRPRPVCYLCGSEGEPLYQGLRDRLFGVPGEWSLKRCGSRDCGLVWLDPMPVEDHLEVLYRNYYTHTTKPSFSKGEDTLFRKRLREAILADVFDYGEQVPSGRASLLGRLTGQSRFIRERVGSTISWLDGSWRGRLIDIGCGNGQFLAEMRELGWDVMGVEPDPKAAEVGRVKYNLKVHSQPLEKAGFTSESIDAITMIHVIEHLPDPLNTLRTAKTLLKKGGHLIIHTPNMNSLGHRWFREDWRGLEPPRHLFLFSPQTLLIVVEMAGLNVLDVKNNSISADFLWIGSHAMKKGINPFDIPDGFHKKSGNIVMGLEHVLTGWPFHRTWGEQIVLIAVKQ